jgi:hypothetical protein
LAFDYGRDPGAFQGRDMEKDVAATIGGDDEAVSLRRVVPLHLSCLTGAMTRVARRYLRDPGRG